MRLEGKVALVTGASRGIGRASALALAAEGADVSLIARTIEQIEAVKEEIETIGRKAAAFKGDVGVESDVRRVVDRTLNAFEKIDILVNNAGVFIPAPLFSTKTEDWDYTLAINLRGPFLFCREVLKDMVPRQSGTIINISSIAGTRSYKEQGAYCASKHGLMGLTRVLAEEMRPLNIRVHAICPGGVDTELVGDDHPNLSLKPIDLMKPEDIADAVVFIACLPPKATIEEVVIKRFGEEHRKAQEEA